MFLEVLFFSAVAIIIGLGFTFAGYRLFRVLLPLWAFFAGLMFGLGAFDAFAGGGFIPTLLGLFIGLIAGSALAAVSYFFFSFAVIVYGATMGFALGQGFMFMLGIEGVLAWLVGLVVGAAFLMVFMLFRMPTFIIVLTTTMGGAMALIMGVLILFGQVPATLQSMGLTETIVSNSFLWIVAWLVLVVMGFIAQYATEREVNMQKAYDWQALANTVESEANAENES